MTAFASLAEVGEGVGATSSKIDKVDRLASCLRGLPDEDLARAAVWLSGRPFPLCDMRKLAVGPSALVRAVSQVAGVEPADFSAEYVRHGDLAATARSLLARRSGGGALAIAEAAMAFERIASARGTKAKQGLLRELLGRSSPLEAEYLVKIITSDMRIGLKEDLVEEAIARAFGCALEEVERANMYLGDLGRTALAARSGKLAEARLELFHPLKFMLANPAADDEELYQSFCREEGSLAVYVEDKYDGVRAQLHADGKRVAIFSRTLDEVGARFPELLAPALEPGRRFILDGEIVAQAGGELAPFQSLQTRLGRKNPEPELLCSCPVLYLAFDLLYFDSEVLLDLPFSERRRALEKLVLQQPLLRAPSSLVTDRAELRPAFESSRARGNEGLVVKESQSPYRPGKRGRGWLKWKQPLGTLDVVVTRVELGHGKRHGVLSDYTFAVRDGERLVEIGKAYSGLTDSEIAEMSRHFKRVALEDHGWWLKVAPDTVIEVAFDNIQPSGRHSSGFALRFPRIVRLRPDKTPAEASTLEDAQEIFFRSELGRSSSRTSDSGEPVETGEGSGPAPSEAKASFRRRARRPRSTGEQLSFDFRAEEPLPED